MNLLLTLHIFITAALIGVILLQRSDSSGGLISSGSSGVFTGRGAANFLTRTTAVLAALFIGNAILMTMVSSASLRRSTSLIDAPQPPPHP